MVCPFFVGILKHTIWNLFTAYRKCSFIVKNPQQGAQRGLPHLSVDVGCCCFSWRKDLIVVQGLIWTQKLHTLYLLFSQASVTLIQRVAVMSRKRLGNLFFKEAFGPLGFEHSTLTIELSFPLWWCAQWFLLRWANQHFVTTLCFLFPEHRTPSQPALGGQSQGLPPLLRHGHLCLWGHRSGKKHQSLLT